ncbi:hypothetical protein AB0G15_05925 [Streptosporangium sp. NPDC023825]|uniref:hypothetical protein n=1 Tax=Streptosporangium sp. NPDC023825 TaxID=3154909 RepID=UPI0034499184
MDDDEVSRLVKEILADKDYKHLVDVAGIVLDYEKLLSEGHEVIKQTEFAQFGARRVVTFVKHVEQFTGMEILLATLIGNNFPGMSETDKYGVSRWLMHCLRPKPADGS